MEKEQISLSLELSLCGDTLTGCARNRTGAGRSFTGWLGLLGAIDALIGEKSPRDHESTSPGIRHASHADPAGGDTAAPTEQNGGATDSPHPAQPKEQR